MSGFSALGFIGFDSVHTKDLDGANYRPLEDSRRDVCLFISRKQAAEALEVSESRYRALYEYANDAIFIMKGEYFIDCNGKCSVCSA